MQVVRLWGGRPSSDSLYFSGHSLKRHTSVSPVASDVDSHHSGEEVPAGILAIKLLFSSLQSISMCQHWEVRLRNSQEGIP